MSRREGSAEKDFDEAAEKTANPLAATGAEDARGQTSFAPSARALRRMPEGPCWPNNFPWFSPDGRTFASGHHSAENELLLTDICTGESTVGVRRPGDIQATSLSPDGTTFCVAGADALAVYRLETGSTKLLEPNWEALPTAGKFTDAAFSRDGQHIASVQSDRAGGGVVEVRDVRSANVMFGLAEFEGNREPGGLAYSAELLAVSGRWGQENGKLVRLLRVASEYELERDLEVAGYIWGVEFNPAGTQLVVTLDWSEDEKMRNKGLVHVFSAANWDAPPLRLPNLYLDLYNAKPARFSHDGSVLAVGYDSKTEGVRGHYALWNLETVTVERVFKHPNGYGHGCAFSPADDLLACGCHENDPHVLHELRGLELIGTSTMPDAQPLCAACASTNVILLACVVEAGAGKKSTLSLLEKKTRLVALRREGPSRGAPESLFAPFELEEEVSADHFPLALDPRGRHFACALDGAKAVTLRDLQTGDELHRLVGFDGWFGGVNYSPDGSLLLVFGAWGTRVFDSATATELHYFQDKTTGETNVHMCAVDRTGQFLVTTGNPGGTAFIRDLKRKGKIVKTLDDDACHTGGVCFDDSGKRVAYWIHGKEGANQTDQVNGQVVVYELQNEINWIEMQRSRIPELGWAQQLCFSPGDGRYLLVAGHPRGGSIMFLDAATGKETEWSPYLRALMLPTGGARGAKQYQGEVPFHTVRWDTRPADSGGEPRLVVQAGASEALYLINVTGFIRAFEEDGNFSLEQLHRLSTEHHHDKIPPLLARWPHLINIRDSESGDTVLHLCARENPISHKAVKRWLSGSAPCPLLENADGFSPIPLCASRWRSEEASRATRAMFTCLDPQLPLERTLTLTKDLVEVGEKWQPQLVDFIECLEDTANYCLFRQQQHKHLLKTRVDEFVVRASEDGSVDARWEEYDGAEVICDSRLEILALQGFAGPPLTGSKDTPYARLLMAVFRAGLSRVELNQLMKTKLFRTTTTFKWEAFARAVQVRRLGQYALHCVLAAAAMLFSSGRIATATDVSGVSVATVLQLLFLTSNTVLAMGEAQQLFVLGAGDYFRSVWNYLDILGITALYTASIAYFIDSLDVLEIAGATGILVITFSFLEMIQSFQSFGLYVVVIAQIAVDIAPFLGIMMMLLYGFATAFAVSMPSGAEYNFERDGLSGPFVTAYLSMLGQIDPGSYSGPVAQAMMVLFMFVMVVVMMNLLIAIMSDSFEKVMEEDPSRIIDLKRAQAIVDQESMMSTQSKQNKERFPRYLQLLQAVNAKGKSWAGLSGKMAEMDENNRILVEEMDAKMDAKMDVMQSEMEAKLQSMQEQTEAKMQAILDAVTAKVGAE